jgi:hypothetical protein
VPDSTDDNPLLVEILTEKANAYFATIRKMQAALAALHHFDQTHLPNTPPPPKHHPSREELLAEAAEQAWFFIIQREAMKLPHYDDLFADYEIPDEVKHRLGPRNVPLAKQSN